jgi:DNA-binding response OmpR family regulator
MTKLPILVIDDDESITSTIATFLQAKGYEVAVVNDGDDALEAAGGGKYSIILSDIYIDQVTGRVCDVKVRTLEFSFFVSRFLKYVIL